MIVKQRNLSLHGRRGLPVAFAALLGGCASFSPDAGTGVARDVAFAELNKDVVKINDVAGAISVQIPTRPAG